MKTVVRVRRVVVGYEEPVFVINVVCKLMNIQEWTLRMLDKNKIVCPHKSKGRTRLYSHRDLDRLRYIQELMKKNDLDIGGLKILQKASLLLVR